jgi:hypothetical protein
MLYLSSTIQLLSVDCAKNNAIAEMAGGHIKMRRDYASITADHYKKRIRK